MSKLDDILRDTITQASEKPNIPAKCRLQRGLVISITATDKAYSLSLARDDVYPSPQEWKTVIQHWAYYTPPPNAVQFIDSDGRFALRGKIPRRHIKQMSFATDDEADAENAPLIK